MSRLSIVAIVAVIVSAIIGATLADDPYRLASTGMPNDQIAVMHRDSPYSHVTWVPARGPTMRSCAFMIKLRAGVS